MGWGQSLKCNLIHNRPTDQVAMGGAPAQIANLYRITRAPCRGDPEARAIEERCLPAAGLRDTRSRGAALSGGRRA
jgi:hypothetical protein